ncbi:MAG: M20 family metallopeptidase [Planctomycetota bacterium]
MTYNRFELDARIQAVLANQRDAIAQIVMKMHANPEVGFEEVKACGWLTEYLRQNGFAVEQPYTGVYTAFKATIGSGSPTLAILAEYDALPSIGHACGHHLSAGLAVGAGVALRDIIKEKRCGTLVVMGTPAEEGGGGKVVIIKNGGFDGIDASVMMHASSKYCESTGGLGIKRYSAIFHGVSSHAAASPERGKNALDGVLFLFNGINAWRQHLPEDTRVHGIITDGGIKPNIVPDLAACVFYLRAPDEATQDMMGERFKQIAQGAALMSDTTVEVAESPETEYYKPRHRNPVLDAAFVELMDEFGLPRKKDPKPGRGSSDIGNVKSIMPAVHPYFSICDEDISLHSVAFAEAGSKPRAIDGMITGARITANVVARYFLDTEFRNAVHTSFKDQKKS